jgi:peroxiredoxin
MKCPLISFVVSLVLFIFPQASSAQSVETANLDREVKEATLHSVGDTAPDFSCRLTDGREFKLSAHRGKVVLLYFFGKIPGACVTEMGYIEKAIVKKLGDRDDFAVLAVGHRLGREEVVSLAGQNKITLPLAADPQAEVFSRYFLKYVPRVVVVRKDGSIAFQKSGYKEIEGILQLQEAVGRELRQAGR